MKKLLRKLGLLAFTYGLSAAAVRFAKSGLPQVKVSDLRPTQSSAGMLEVEEKKERIQALAPKELEKYLEKHPIPVVLGPKEKYYMIDHHHLALALNNLGKDHVYVDIVKDFSSSASKEDFWQKMEKHGYVYLRDENEKKITPSDLPEKIDEIKDDPYRSLAGAVRDAGGFTKSRTPFAEFTWAHFFKTHIEFKNTKKGLTTVLGDAIKLAHSKDAKDLPGYIGG